ncbi:hypothetical protein ACFL31_01695 [Candidatus Margulisiibacteriota bacterium]
MSDLLMAVGSLVVAGPGSGKKVGEEEAPAGRRVRIVNVTYRNDPEVTGRVIVEGKINGLQNPQDYKVVSLGPIRRAGQSGNFGFLLYDYGTEGTVQAGRRFSLSVHYSTKDFYLALVPRAFTIEDYSLVRLTDCAGCAGNAVPRLPDRGMGTKTIYSIRGDRNHKPLARQQDSSQF